jgi:signal transduction histidine kinase/ActR/RegA family two-component response regulator
MRNIPDTETQSFYRTLPWSVFHQIGGLLKQINQPDSVIFTESVFPPFNPRAVEPFVLVISQRFCALLQGEMIHSESGDGISAERNGQATPHQNPDHNGLTDTLCQMRLTFDPEAIAAFLTHLEPLLPSSILQRLRSLKDPIQPNDAKIQTTFTLQLIELLAAQASYSPSSAETALRQQVEQERLINDVTTLIRQSLELPVILETAVQQVRQFLKADRLIIYQFNVLAPSCSLKSEPTESTQQPEAPHLDGITYEARKNDSIPSILHQMEDPHTVRARQVDGEEISQANPTGEMPFIHSERVQAELVMPIVVRDKMWGLLIAHQCFAPRHWQDHEKACLQRIAGHLAIAIYQAKLYAQVHQQKATLEQQVIDRTQDLRDTLVAAQSASRAKTEFLATMSHELRSPLTTIIGMSSTLLRYQSHQSNKKGALTLQKQQEYLQTIQSRGEHLLALINDILDLSQVETGKIILDVREFSLFELAQHTLDLLKEKADRSQIQLHLDWRIEAIAEIDSFKADYHRVKQILVNLLSNAIKFTSEGGSVTLRVWLNDDTAILQVEDTGIGIPEHQIPLLFQKFQQLDTSYHRKYEGTGLGLALTKQLVELHDGKIEVTSTVGVGSRFTVHLPAQSLSGVDRAKKRLATALHPRILLIESHEETATLICDLLTAANYQVVWTIEGTTALRQIEMLQPVAVIVDCQLLGMDGYKVIRRLRQDPSTHNFKVLALITQADAHVPIQCLEAGANDYLIKPISHPEHLIDKVTALVMERSEREL